MSCKSCESESQKEFRTEIAIHLADRNKPLVFIFPKLLVCLNCGNAAIGEEFSIPRDELVLLSRPAAASG